MTILKKSNLGTRHRFDDIKALFSIEQQNTIRYLLLASGAAYLLLFYWLESSSHFWFGEFIGPSVLIACYFLYGLGLYLSARFIFSISNKLVLTTLIISPALIRMLNPPLGTYGSPFVFACLYLIVCCLVFMFFTLKRKPPLLHCWRSLLIAACLCTSLVVSLFVLANKEFSPQPSFLTEISPSHSHSLNIRALEKGPYKVKHLTYGSGKDKHRPEYASQADVITESVDASLLLDNWHGIRRWLRQMYWGFDASNLPLQGRVWMPEEEGTYPLLLMVHGNHEMERFSDDGFDYLGSFLASKGYVFVSLDQNFLNGSNSEGLYSIAWRLNGELDARAWLMLKHLEVWRAWYKQGNKMAAKVDLSQIILLGHSRGGEAAAIASVFNKLNHYPDNSALSFDFNFDIKGVVALAPSDGQYKPRASQLNLSDVNYLTVQGSMDGDARSFMGQSVYKRTQLTDKPFSFKSSVYIRGANHSHFNTSWQGCDGQKFSCWTQKQNRMLLGEQQRQLTQLLLLSFADSVTKDKTQDLAMFQRPSYFAKWLPNIDLMINYADSSQRILASFEDDANLSSIESGYVEAKNMRLWKETWPRLKWTALDSHVVELAWGYAESTLPASYSLRFEPTISGAPCIGFSAANTLNESQGEPIDFSLELTYSGGEKTRFSLNEQHKLLPQFINDVRIEHLFKQTAFSEPVMQAFYFPIPEPHLQDHIESLSFIFDKSKQGHIYIDDVVSGDCLD